MAKSLNRAEIIGRLGQAVELRYSQSGVAVANISVATSHNIKRNDVWEEETSWHKVVIFGKTAEACEKYLSKGSQIFVEGRLQTKSWTPDDGIKRWSTEIVANSIIFLDSKQGQKQDRPPSPPAEADSGGYDPGDDSGQVLF